MAEKLNKMAVITGGTRGIGKTVALRCAHLGYDVCCIARKQEELDKIAEKIQDLGVECVTYAASVSDYEALGKAMEKAAEKYGAIDVLVNCAGTGVMDPFEELSLEDIDKTIDVNLKGTIYAVKQAYSFMVARGGNIINVSSMSGIRGIPHPCNVNGIYTASKFGVNGFSECMQKYLAPKGVLVTTLCPGSTDTTWWEGWSQDFSTEVMIKPETIADFVELILKSPKNTLFKMLQVLPAVEINSF